ncbi:MAG: phosphatidylglycerophosphatase A [Woeseiaceae bacterium]|nr:phosphatidylglycerophosphatase A [Woeseiaceae bacterium]
MKGRELAAVVLRDPLHWLAFGFGTGLSPIAPGTVGSLVGLVIAWLVQPFDITVQAVVGLALVVSGIGICGASARRIGVHDHPGIVWDEIAAMYLVAFWLPPEPLYWGAAFAAFRLFDIWKPWPISDLDHRMTGGAGIMLDDLVAALYTACLLVFGGWLLT